MFVEKCHSHTKLKNVFNSSMFLNVLILVTPKLNDLIIDMIVALIGPSVFFYSADMEHNRKQRGLSEVLLLSKLSTSSASGNVRGRMTSAPYESEWNLCGRSWISGITFHQRVFLHFIFEFAFCFPCLHIPGFICTVLQAGISLCSVEGFSTAGKMTAVLPKH